MAKRFSRAEVGSAIRHFLAFGEQTYCSRENCGGGCGKHHGVFSGAGADASILRAHLEDLMRGGWKPLSELPEMDMWKSDAGVRVLVSDGKQIWTADRCGRWLGTIYGNVPHLHGPMTEWGIKVWRELPELPNHV